METFLVYVGILFLISSAILIIGFIYINRKIIHIELLNENDMSPIINMNIYGTFSYSLGGLGYTSSGEMVRTYGGNEIEYGKKIGKTDENGVFKKIYYLSAPSFMVFPIYSKKSKLPQQINIADIQIKNGKQTKKTIILDKDNELKVLNPNKKPKNKWGL